APWARSSMRAAGGRRGGPSTVSSARAARRRELGRLPPPGALLAGVLAAALLLWHTAYWRAGADLGGLPSSRRYWEDLAVAATRFLDEDGRAGKVGLNSADGAALRLGFRRFLTRAAADVVLIPCQFCRTVPFRPLHVFRG